MKYLAGLLLCAFVLFPTVSFCESVESTPASHSQKSQAQLENRIKHITHLVEMGRTSFAKNQIARALAAFPGDETLTQIKQQIAATEEAKRTKNLQRVRAEKEARREKVLSSQNKQMLKKRIRHVQMMIDNKRYDIAEREIQQLLKRFPKDKDLLSLKKQVMKLNNATG